MSWRWAVLVVLSATLGCVLAGPRHRRVSAEPRTSASIAAAPSFTPAAPLATTCNETAAAAYWPSVPLVPDTVLAAPSVVVASPPTAQPAPPTAVASPSPAQPAATEAKPLGTPVPGAATAPAIKYAALDDATCAAELKKRGVPYALAGNATGVDLGIRFTGKLHGVDIHGLEPPAKRPTSPWEIVDCRLALALDDFAKILAAHDVVEAIHMSIYRPPGKGVKKFARHDAALAIDLGTLVKKDGTKLVVLDHWHGYIGAKTCGPGAGPSPATKEAVELRKILCETADANLFNVVLTPNYNKPHANHFHLEVTRGVKWFIVH